MYKKAVKCNECKKLICTSSTGLLSISAVGACCPHCGQDFDSFSLDGSVGNAEGFSIVTIRRKPGFLNWLNPSYEEVKRNVREA